ncbi:MAG: hypothetical protein ABSG86_17790 [Thermoguttaceae bacterium]
MAWIVGFLLVPVILVLKEEYNLHLPVAVPPLSVIVTVIACGLAIGRFRISIAARIGLFLLTAVLWWVANLGVFVVWYFHPG